MIYPYSAIEPAPPSRTRLVLHRLAVSLLVFSGALTLLFSLAGMLLLPPLTRIEVAGSLLDASGLREHRETLLADIAEAEAARDRATLALHDPVYKELLEGRHAERALGDIRGTILRVAEEVRSSAETIRIDSLVYEPSLKSVTLKGAVLSTRSIPLLAAFVQRLRTLSFVERVEDPRYVRTESSEYGPESPFDDLVLFLQ